MCTHSSPWCTNGRSLLSKPGDLHPHHLEAAVEVRCEQLVDEALAWHQPLAVLLADDQAWRLLVGLEEAAHLYLHPVGDLHQGGEGGIAKAPLDLADAADADPGGLGQALDRHSPPHPDQANELAQRPGVRPGPVVPAQRLIAVRRCPLRCPDPARW